MADYNLGTARGTIEIDYKGDGARRARDDLGATGKAAGSAGMSMDEVGRKTGRAGLVIAAGLAVAGKTAADFEARISAIAAVSGATGSELDAIRAKALQLGKDTAFSASESAQAMEELIKAGLSVDDVLNGAADATVALAAAGEVDMATAATIASNAMNQFNLSAEDMTGVVDNIAGAANASAIDVGEFGMSLQQVGAVANLAGVNFEDAATAIALLGNAGIRGSDAGTSLKAMFQRLQPTTEKAYNTMEDLGLITGDLASANKFLQKEGLGTAKTMGEAEAKFSQLAASMGKGEVGTVKNAKAARDLMLQYGGLRNQFYDAEGNTRSLAEVSEKLRGALKGMSAEQKQAALQTLFGADAIRAAAILADNGAKGFEEMGESMGKVSAADVAAKRLDNFKGSLEQMMGSLETLGIVVGTMVLPSIRKLVDGITAGLNVFLNLPTGVQGAVVGLLAFSAGALLAIASIIKIMQAVRAWQAAMVTLRVILVGTAAAQNMSTLAAIRHRAATIAAAVAERIRQVASLAGTVGLLAMAAAQWALNAAMSANPIALIIIALVALAAILVLLWKKSETFRNIVIAVWDAIKAAAVAVWGAIKTAVSAGMNAVMSIVRAITGVLAAVWRSFWGTFGGIIKAAWGLVVAIVRLGWIVVKGLFILYLRAVLAVVRSVWNTIVGIFRRVWGIIKGIVRAGANFVRAIVVGVWNGIRAVTGAVWNGIMAVIRAVWGKIGGTVKSAARSVEKVISGAWNAVKSVTSKVWGAIAGVVGKAISGVVKVVSGLKGKVTGAIGDAGRWLYDAGRKVIQGLINGIESMLNSLRSKVSSAAGIAKKFLPGSPVQEGPLRVLNRGYAGKQIVKMVIDGIDSMERPLQQTMATITSLPPIEADLSRVASSGNIGSTALLPRTAMLGSDGAAAPTTLRLVEGKLSIDKSGRAFIRGVAEEVVVDDRSFHARGGRQGRR